MSCKPDSDKPLVSVIVPAYNAAPYIEHTLRSLVSQTYPNIEIVVVDDGSCDATVPLIQGMARLHSRIRVIQQRNAGVAAARNRGLQMSRGAFIAPVDADDLWHPEAAERLATCLSRSDRSVGIAYAWSVTIDQDGLFDHGFRCSMVEGNVFNTLLCHNFIGNASATMIRRACLDQVGGYDSQYREHDAQGCEDWDLYLRVAEHFQFRVVPEFLVAYRRSDSNMSSDVSSMARSHGHLLRNVSKRHPTIPKVLYGLSTSSYYVYLAHECYRRRLPLESYRWLRQALATNAMFTLLRPGCYTLVAKNALALFGSLSDGPRRGENNVVGHDITTTFPGQPAEVVRRRARIRMGILAQDILHRLVSRRPTS